MFDVEKVLEERFYDAFSDAMEEAAFEFLTEGDLHHTVEKIVCEAKGIGWEQYVDDSGGDLYDLVWHDATELSSGILHKLMKRFVKEQYNG